MMRRRIYAAVAILLLASSAYVLSSIYSFAGENDIRIGPHHFFIPAEYGPSGFMNLSVRWFTSQFQSQDIAVFVISEEELRENIPNYEVGRNGIPRNIKGLIRVWSAEQIEVLENSQRYSTLWRGTGPYQNRQVVRKGNFFLVYRNPSSQKTWTVLKQNPAEKTPLPSNSFDFWVARCKQHSKTLQKSEVFTVCNSYVFVDDVVIEFYLAEENLRYIDEVRNFIVKKVGNWY